MSSSKVFTGILAGFAAGAAVGILFAPDKGEVTRHKISEKSKDLSEDVKKRYNEVAETVGEQYDNVKGAFQDIKANSKS